MTEKFHLAQLNIGRLVAPVDSPLVADFMALLDPVNALADAAPGFVWRLQTEEGNATSLHIYGDDTLNVNMSVWESKQALWDYGFNLGVAFQLVDDLLDYTADENALGKPVGGDLREGKVTLPIIFLLRRGGEAADSLIRGVVRDRAVSTEQWREILRLMREHRTTELAYDRAVEYASRAKDSLSAFPPGREREALAALTDYVLARDR